MQTTLDDMFAAMEFGGRVAKRQRNLGTGRCPRRVKQPGSPMREFEANG